MEIDTIRTGNSKDVSIDSLISYLSQIVLIKTDEEMEIRDNKIKQLRYNMVEKQKRGKELKDRLLHVYSESRRLDALLNVLNLISTLKKEGVLIGKNRAKVFRLLDEIDEQSFQTLKSLEGKLSIHLPKNNRVSIS